MKKSIPFAFISLLAAGLMAGCNNNSNSGNNGFGTNCGAPPNGFQILYPRNNAPRVPPGISGVYVAANPALPVGNAFNFVAQQSGGGSQFTSSFAVYNGPSSSIPNPHNTPAPGSTIYITTLPYPIGPLQTVQLLWNDGGTGCTPNAIVSTFTTST
jgi:hypothetical protein